MFPDFLGSGTRSGRYPLHFVGKGLFCCQNGMNNRPGEVDKKGYSGSHYSSEPRRNLSFWIPSQSCSSVLQGGWLGWGVTSLTWLDGLRAGTLSASSSLACLDLDSLQMCARLHDNTTSSFIKDRPWCYSQTPLHVPLGTRCAIPPLSYLRWSI